jgi:hypothetical protein
MVHQVNGLVSDNRTVSEAGTLFYALWASLTARTTGGVQRYYPRPVSGKLGGQRQPLGQEKRRPQIGLSDKAVETLQDTSQFSSADVGYIGLKPR